MSVVFDSRDVTAVGPALGLGVVSSSPAYGGAAAQDNKQGLVSCLPNGEISTVIGGSVGFGVGSEKPEAASESSSIGVPDDSDDDEGEVQSKPYGSSLASLTSLEESLPINRRGLSNNFSGKSKSFANLSEISTVREIEKRENPLNKRRRTMIAYKWSHKSSLYGCRVNNTSMSLLALNGVVGEEQDEDDDDSKEEDQRFRQQLKGSQSCFSLTDLPK